jgi:hypothetical protein
MAGELEPAATDHVTGTATGVIVGGAIAAVALAVAAPLLVVPIGIAAAVGLPLTWLAAGIGGWIGYNKAASRAAAHGIRRG